ncbi:transposase [Alkalihalobacterium sp. APHAB7]|uniref:transposase n=1 Tax=Alkalihalobacterium sp. APHAB7 TaxID=3402081 RepID=UPI003AABB539
MELMTSWEKKGFDKGVEKGFNKGIEKGIEKVAKQMLLKGFTTKDIQDLTSLSVEEIEKLKMQLDKG